MITRHSNTSRNAGPVFSVSQLRRSLLMAGICLCSAHTVALANTERDLDSHEHGAANINVVIDGATVFVELESPWNNLVGFEHSPSTDSQRDAVASALQTLSNPADIFVFNDSAACQVSSAEVESSLDADGDHDDHKEHDDEHAEHDDHKEHDDEHAEHDDHKEHDDEHAEHDHGDEATHSEVVAMYSFDCENPDKLASVEVGLFDLYSGFEAISYQAAGPSGQTGAELSASVTTLDLSGVR